MARGMVALAAALAAVMVMAPAAVAVDTQCSGVLEDAYANVVVAPGGSCRLSDADVSGSVTAYPGSKISIDRSRIGGSVVADRPEVMEIYGGSTVGGNVQITGGWSGDEAGRGGLGLNLINLNLFGDQILGDVMVRDLSFLGTPGRLFQISNNDIRGSLRVLNNHGAGSKSVTGNRVSHTLQCLGNALPFTSELNMAASTEGQCF